MTQAPALRPGPASIGPTAPHLGPFPAYNSPAEDGMNCYRCAAPAAEDASFCAACGAALQFACARCGRSASPDAAFCAGCGAPLERHAARETPPAAAADFQAGERRIATVLFSDLSGYTALNERLDPEEVGEIMDEIKRDATSLVEAYGGIVNQFVGDEVMALFGLPTAEDDDPRRAVAAALELHERVRSLDRRLGRRLPESLSMHTGIQTGLLIAQLRDQRDGLYGVIGDTVNTAGRLLKLAGPDEVWIGADTFRLVKGFFETESGGRHTVKGKAEPVEAFRVLGRRAVGSRFEAAQERGLTPRIGRASELARLEQAFARAADGRGQVVTLVGEAGVGKSRLVHDFRSGIDPETAYVFEGGCQAYGSVTPYLPFIQALRSGVGVSENDTAEEVMRKTADAILGIDPSLESLLPLYLQLLSAPSKDHPIPAEMAGEELPGAIRQAVVALNVALSQQRPVVLHLEDWHWADEASDGTFANLARYVPEHRILIVLSHRPQLRPQWTDVKTDEIALLPFDRADTVALVAHCFGAGQVEDALATRIHERTLGNPFFVEEICVSLAQSDALRREGDTVVPAGELTTLELPESVQAVLRSRMDKLEPRAREVLRFASVIGREFPFELLSRLVPNGWSTLR